MTCELSVFDWMVVTGLAALFGAMIVLFAFVWKAIRDDLTIYPDDEE